MDFPDQNRWADVVFPHPPAGHFTYAVPERFRQDLAPGSRVLVPLGNRRLTGFVARLVDVAPEQEVKAVEDLLDAEPLLTPELMDLTGWMADYYLTPWGDVMRTALPPGLLKKERIRVSAIAEAAKPAEGLEAEVWDCLMKTGPLFADQLRRRLGQPLPAYQLSRLARQGLVTLNPVLDEAQARIQTEALYALARPVEDEALDRLRRRAPRQAQVVETLMGARQAIPRPDLDVPMAVLRRLEEDGWIVREERERIRNPYDPAGITPAKAVTLTQEQAAALEAIRQAAARGGFQGFLLHGVTASGKTQVYIEAIRDALDRGQTALVLIPEISLTPQAVARYQGAFGDRVAVLHSRMSVGERYDAWREIRRGRYAIALGPRSAVFAPLDNLGLVVVDEEHDGSYKQIDPAPRYHARDVAVMRASMTGARVVLGSATPSLESFFNAQEGKYRLISLKQRIDGVAMPEVRLLDRSKLEAWDENRVFDERLLEAMRERIAAGEQVILLQNRRGFATFLRCGACGAIETCPHCDISLTFHQSGHWLRCHYCGFQKRAMDACTACGGATLKYRGVGTQRVEEALKAQLPEVRLIRMDQDTTQLKGAHERLIHTFEAGEADVLIGTQMVAKGHDFPGVHLVGIVSADTGLHFPDFRAGERTFQLLTQTAGRAGRRDRQGLVLVQTLYSDHPVLDFAKEHDYNGFYTWELAQRRELGYPPWGRLALIRLKGTEQEAVAQAAQRFRGGLRTSPGVDILGPVPSPLARLQNLYRYQIVLRTRRDTDPSGKGIRQMVKEGVRRYQASPPAPGVRLAVDIDPVDLL